MSAPHPLVCNPSPSPLTTYLGEINGIPLLSADEEKALARRVRQGDSEARDQLARANLRLVVKIAQGYAGRGLGLDDLVAEGNLGLLRAVVRFDPDVGTRFGTYAGYWITQAMRQAVLDAGHAVRVPPSTARLATRWRRASEHLRGKLGRPPTEDEVAGALCLTRKGLRIVRAALLAFAGSVQEGEADSGRALEDWLPDRHAEEPGDALGQADESRQLWGMLGRLGGREAAVLKLRFGLDGRKPQSLAEVGGRLRLSRERVRQIERRALHHLRRSLGPTTSRSRHGTSGGRDRRQ
jgi:RNA polymerase primary sigma factor